MNKSEASAWDELIAVMAERDPKLFEAIGTFLTFTSLSRHECDEATAR